jgi:hypothetical protein
MTKRRFLHLIPFLIICISLTYTCWNSLSDLDVKDHIALAGAAINLLLYLIRFKYGILTTGILLVLATFSLLRLFPVVITFKNSVQFNDIELHTPIIELESLLLTVFYFVLNKRYLVKLYYEYKKSKHS